MVSRGVLFNFNKRYFSQIIKWYKVSDIEKIVHPFSSVTINTGIKTIIRPFDLLDCPNANKLRATLFALTNNSSAKIHIITKDNNIIINSIVKEKAEQIKCLLEIPVRASIKVNSTENVEVKDIHSDLISIKSNKSINTHNIRGTEVLLNTEGNIETKGILLGKNITICTKDEGKIYLDKLQGDTVKCQSERGSIEVNASYVENSKFTSDSGLMLLNNIHKKSEVYILKHGNIEMNGIHGNIYIKSNGGDMDLQFSEIYGDNIVLANSSEMIKINISDKVEQECSIEIIAANVILQDSLKYLASFLERNNYFNMKKTDNKLQVSTSGILKFGKLSWADNIKRMIKSYHKNLSQTVD